MLTRFDVTVIGGGIHGAGVAQAAAAAGYSVVVLEQTGLASGTSSRSSKLIHGGLRYLESGDVRLVRESLRERELLLRLAPSLVHRQTFYIPIYRDTKRSALWVRAGLSLYSLLAGFRPECRFRAIARKDWDQLDGLRTEGLTQVFAYPDAQTDDQALTQAVMHSATELGAQVICPARFHNATRTDTGYRVSYFPESQSTADELHTGFLVNAAGPWANHVLEQIHPSPAPFPVDLVQGAHLEFLTPLKKGCYYLEMPDGRAVFVMPWKGHTLVGTTEHAYVGNPADVRPLDEEIDYLTQGLRLFFPQQTQPHFNAWAGLRVLPTGTGRAFSRSRETQLPLDDHRKPRLLSVFGGKLTGYRATAEKVVRIAQRTLPPAKRQALTSSLPLGSAALKKNESTESSVG